MIEEAKLENKEEIYQLICILENKEIKKEHFDQVYEEGLKDPNTIYLVYRDEKIVGFLSFKIHHYLHHDFDTGEIVELIVLPEKRNLQIGKKLIEKIEEIARERNLEQIELSTSTYRKDAHRFYERQGYEKLHYNYTKEIDD